MNIALHATRMAFPRLAAETVQRTHLIGIAGSGMKALAEVLLRRGLRLTGSDLDSSAVAWLSVLLDDAAHHSTQIAATLAALRETFPDRRIWCVVQPHYLSRTPFLLDELAASLRHADRVAVTDVYPAREAPDDAAAHLAEKLAVRVRGHGPLVLTARDTNDILKHVSAALTGGDVLITLGAGNIREVCDGLARRLRTYRAAS